MPAKKKTNLVEEHIEKAVVAVGGLILVYCLIAYMIRSPGTSMIGTETVKPGQAYNRVRQDADRLERRAVLHLFGMQGTTVCRFLHLNTGIDIPAQGIGT